MTRCRLHVILPDDADVPDETNWNEQTIEELHTAFEDAFEQVDTARIQETKQEWVSEVFEETDRTLTLVDEFEETCHDLFPAVDTLSTRQQRDTMDGRGTEFEYDDAIMIQLTFQLAT